MKRKGQMNMMVGLAIAIIMMVVIFGVIFVFIRDTALDVQGRTNESVVLTSGVGNTADDDLTGTVILQNDTSSTDNFAGHCNVTTATGKIECNASEAASLTTGLLVTYDFFPEAYLTSGTTRTLVSTISILLAIVMLVFLAGFLTTKV